MDAAARLMTLTTMPDARHVHFPEIGTTHREAMKHRRADVADRIVGVARVG